MGYSQITFDFFTPPTTPPVSKKPGVGSVDEEAGLVEHENTIDSQAQDPVPNPEEIVEIVFPEQAELPSGPVDQLPQTPTEKPVEAPAKSTRGRKSLKSFDLAADLVQVPEDEELFRKQYYSIGEVSEMFKVNPSLLRFWEAEFDIIQPRKNRKGDRHFRPVDIKNLQLIYDLLRRRKLTIEGAKDFIKRNKKAKERFETIQNLQKIRSFLVELRASL